MASRSLTREELREYQGEDRVISSYEMQEILQNKPEQLFKIKSELPTLDSMTGGFCGGNLVIISGPTGNGKTLLAQTLTQRFCTKKKEPLWFSYELPPAELLNTFDALPYFLLPAQLQHGSMDWFEDRVIESLEKHRSRIVIIDHLHFLIDMFRIRNPSLEIGACVRRLKRFAVKEGLIVFLICHIHKIQEGASVRYHHIRDSSFVAQEADTVLMIQRLKPKQGVKNRAELRVEKCRKTGVMGEALTVMKAGGYLVEVTAEH
jgi:archaellum biogenesis ATPase FlaH